LLAAGPLFSCDTGSGYPVPAGGVKGRGGWGSWRLRAPPAPARPLARLCPLAQLSPLARLCPLAQLSPLARLCPLAPPSPGIQISTL